MTDKLQTIKDKLQAVLCNPDGNVCIRGSEGDRAIIQQALAALNSYMEARISEETVERVAEAIYEISPTGGTYLSTWGGLCDMATRKHSGYFELANHLKHKAEAEAKAAIKAMEGVK